MSNKILMIYMNYENNYFLDKVYDKIFKLIKCDNLGEVNSNIDISSYSIISNDNNKRSLSIGCPPCANYINDNNNKNNNNNIEKNEEEEETMLENNLMDKSKTANLTKKEKDLKIFGSYEDVEITDVIERHFILERCFSTYALIKFSLLNILGVTRSFKDMKIPNEKVIEILCDFCIKTHSLVKKYMEIYRKIFETMKERNEEEETMLENNLMDKSKTANLTKKEKDLKIFGSYEDVEITDVIERHFILERCFSTYALIKFSLLNILGVTRSFKDMKIPNEKVIEILCDFCIKTHSLVKKYMEIYKNIFETMKERKIISDKKQCDDCINIVTDYLKKTNEIEKEEITKSFTNISKNGRKN